MQMKNLHLITLTGLSVQKVTAKLSRRCHDRFKVFQVSNRAKLARWLGPFDLSHVLVYIPIVPNCKNERY